MYGKSNKKNRRKGISTTEMVLIIGGLVLVIIGTVAAVGQRVSSDLGTTASDVANPAQLTDRFTSP